MNMIGHLPQGACFTVPGGDRAQLSLTTVSIIVGGHVRVGLENNIYYRKGELARGNAQLVERVVRIANELGREVTSCTEARQILGIA